MVEGEIEQAAADRWRYGVRVEGRDAVRKLWDTLDPRPTLLVLGAGFDPRATAGLELLAGTQPELDLVVVRLPEVESAARMVELAEANQKQIGELAEKCRKLEEISLPDAEARRSPGVLLSRQLHGDERFAAYDRIVVDISSLPRSVYFPLVGGILAAAQAGRWTGDLHVLVCENPEIDRAITEEGAATPTPLGGFSGEVEDGAEPTTTIWVPVLGEGQIEQVDALYRAIEPREVCPVLPFPADNPRRPDELLREFRPLLFDTIGLDPRNLIHASEWNPYDLYRALGDLDRRYRRALEPLGGARLVCSAHSSKLLSIGVLLAAQEHGLRVMHVSPTGYLLDGELDIEAVRQRDRISDLWLTGEPYA